MIKSKDAIGVITARRKSGNNMILTIKNPYTGATKKIPVIESIYKTILKANKRGINEFYINYYKEYVDDDNQAEANILTIISSLCVVKNYSMQYTTIQGRGETVDKFEAMFINKNAE